MARAMKDSGVDWIGQIPENWKIGRVKNAFSNHKDIVGKESEAYERLALTLNGVIKRDKNDIQGLQPENFGGYQILRENELVFKLIDLQNISTSRVGYSPYTGIVSPAYIILTPKNNISSKFGEYFFKSMWQREIFNHIGDDGVRSSLNASDLLNIPYVLLDNDEQKKIAAFLDDKCAAIDEIITKTEQSIEEYKKLKQAVITKAVTQGIRPNRTIKDSGIDWIGKIPVDWDVKRFRFIAKKFLKGNGITKEDVKEDGDTPCVRYGEIYSKYNYSFKKCLSYTNVQDISTPQYFGYGDILFACTGELVEEIGKNIVYLGTDKCLAGGDIIIATHQQHPKFLSYALNSGYCTFQKSRNKIKLKVVHISAPDIKNIYILLPSSEEQKEIADYLDMKCTEIDALIEKKQQSLTELASYKKSLIYEYVTGKKEVD